ncbi:hypothetical protein M3Y99_00663300 [Aphelenchoides fujianensis]|nr:hypothetical protein M3Y99_00663300 [Aphelenchoides fujianensis]
MSSSDTPTGRLKAGSRPTARKSARPVHKENPTRFVSPSPPPPPKRAVEAPNASTAPAAPALQTAKKTGGGTRFACHECGKDYPSKGRFRRHFERRHSKPQQQQVKPPKEQQKKQERKRYPQKRVKCVVCKQTFCIRRLRNRHEQREHDYHRPPRPSGRPRQGDESPEHPVPEYFRKKKKRVADQPSTSSTSVDTLETSLESSSTSSSSAALPSVSTSSASPPGSLRESSADVAMNEPPVEVPDEVPAMAPPTAPVVPVEEAAGESTAPLGNLLRFPAILYYDFDTRSEECGNFPLLFWKQSAACKLLLVRSSSKDAEAEIGLGPPAYASSMPRQVPRKGVRVTHVLAFFKDDAGELRDGALKELKTHPNFGELVQDVTPALLLSADSTAVFLASDLDLASVKPADLAARGIFFD